MFNITSWNINPNQDWYVKLQDTGSNISIGLYNSLSDAQGSSNIVASASVAYGDSVGVLMEMDASGSPIISFFNSAVPYHLNVTGAFGDVEKIYHLYPFVDLPEINNSVYRSEDLIIRRVTNEINTHTHVAKSKTVSLSTLIDGLGINDIMEIDSDFRGESSSNVVDSITISGSNKSLLCSIGCTEYLDFKR